VELDGPNPSRLTFYSLGSIGAVFGGGSMLQILWVTPVKYVEILIERFEALLDV
jgi:hypothetical protein